MRIIIILTVVYSTIFSKEVLDTAAIFYKANDLLHYEVTNIDEAIKGIKTIEEANKLMISGGKNIYHQKIFLHRNMTTKRFITQEYQCINNLSYKLYGGQKNIINLESFKGLTSCHNFKGKKQVLSLDEWRFNHYIFCEHGKRSINRRTWKYEHSIDNSMNRYYNLFNEN